MAENTPPAADPNKPADIPAASEINPSGAPEQIVPDVDMSHPAVDADPRAGTSVLQNRIDFNDPTLTGAEASAKALSGQGVPTATGEAAGSKKPAAKRGQG